jgi:hypothetical protein
VLWSYCSEIDAFDTAGENQHPEGEEVTARGVLFPPEAGAVIILGERLNVQLPEFCSTPKVAAPFSVGAKVKSATRGAFVVFASTV